MALEEERFAKIIETPCPKCGLDELLIRAYVPARFQLLDGEAYGAPKFSYKGEELARGTYLIECVSCKEKLYASDACSKCGKNTLENALASNDAHARPKACPGCRDEQVGYVVWVPILVTTHGSGDAKRPDKPKTRTQLDDEGCHGIRVECKDCLYTQSLTTGKTCGLCGERLESGSAE